MIRKDANGLYIDGNPIELMADLTAIMKILLKDKIVDAEKIEYCLKIAQYDDETLLLKTKEALESMVKRIPQPFRSVADRELKNKLKQFVVDNKCLTCDHHENCLGFSIAKEIDNDDFSITDFLLNHRSENRKCFDGDNNKKHDIFNELFKDIL